MLRFVNLHKSYVERDCSTGSQQGHCWHFGRQFWLCETVLCVAEHLTAKTPPVLNASSSPQDIVTARNTSICIQNLPEGGTASAENHWTADYKLMNKDFLIQVST